MKAVPFQSWQCPRKGCHRKARSFQCHKLPIKALRGLQTFYIRGAAMRRPNNQRQVCARLFGKSRGSKETWTDPMEGYQEPHLYESTFGLPIVRRRVTYSELLRDMRQQKVREISYFDCNYAPDKEHKTRMLNIDLEGYCLVIYHDNSVAQAYIPPGDVRMNYAMETHGVTQSRMLGEPGPGGILDKPFNLGFLEGKLVAVLPVALMIALWIATQFAAWLKGDRADREAIRAYDIRKEKLARQQAEADERAQLPVTMARQGASVDTICRTLDLSKTPYSRDYIERLVTDTQATPEPLEGGGELIVTKEQQQREQAMTARIQREQDDNMNEMDRARELLKMKTVKIQQASAPEDAEQREMRIRMRKAQSEMKGVKLQYTDDGRVTFDDVAGIGESKTELTEIVEFFTKPGRFKASGARVPKGLLMCGPPGTGKTLMARAVAGEARVLFLSLNASEFVEMFAGLGASRVRDLFRQARSLAPSIIFIDEIDAVGRQRGGAKGNDERDQTLNQLLIEMDGFGDESQVIVMAATNRVDVLDAALVRPGRFDRIIEVGLPDFQGRQEVLKVHLGYRAHSEDIDYSQLSFDTQAFSGAQLAGLVNSAAIVASRHDRDAISMADFNEALEQERLGPKKQGLISQEWLRRIAIKEGATALVCCLMPAIEPVTYVTTVPRERNTLGLTVVKVDEDRERNNLFSRRYLEDQLMTVLAGRAAEEIECGLDGMSTINTGRITLARTIAAKLVYSGAMSDRASQQNAPLAIPLDLGDGSEVQMISERVGPAREVEADFEMFQLLNGTYTKVKELLERNKEALHQIVERLCISSDPSYSGNTLSGEDLNDIVTAFADRSDIVKRDMEKATFM